MGYVLAPAIKSTFEVGMFVCIFSVFKGVRSKLMTEGVSKVCSRASLHARLIRTGKGSGLCISVSP